MKKVSTGTKTPWNDFGVTITEVENPRTVLDRESFNKMQQGEKMTSSEASNAIHQLFSRLCLLEAKVRGDYTGEIEEADEPTAPDET